MDKSKRILVTGATGLVGSYLINALHAQGYHQLIGMKRENSRMGLVESIQDKVEWVNGDVLDVPFLEDAFENVDVVFHTAAMVSLSKKDHDKMMDVNINGTANIVNVCLYRNVKSLIHVSSIAALGRSTNGKAIHEGTPWVSSKYNSKYAQSKYLSEMEVWRGQAEGLKTAIVNPSVILGAGYWKRSSLSIYDTLFRGVAYYPSGGNGVVDVRDVVDALIILLETGIQDERFIINGHNVLLKDLVQDIAQGLQVPKPEKELKGLVRWLSWRVEYIRSFFKNSFPLITKESVASTSKVWIYKNEKSIKDLNLTYRPYDETIKDSCQAFLKSKENQKAFGLLKNV